MAFVIQEILITNDEIVVYKKGQKIKMQIRMKKNTSHIYRLLS